MDSNFPDSINAVKSSKHKNIPGTRLYVVLPDSFTIITNELTGIIKDSSQFIQVTDLIGDNFYVNTKGLTKENLAQSPGAKLLAYKELKVSGFSAKLLLRQFDSLTKIYTLVFGDSTFCTTLVAFCAINDAKTPREFEGIFKSVFYDTLEIIDPFALAKFRLNDSKSIFKFAKSRDNNYTYSIGGIKKESYEHSPHVEVFSTLADGMSLRSFANALASVVVKPVIKHLGEGKTNGFPSLEREIEGTINGEHHHLYELAVLIDDTIVIVTGTANDNFDKYLSEFKKLSNTIDRK